MKPPLGQLADAAGRPAVVDTVGLDDRRPRKAKLPKEITGMGPDEAQGRPHARLLGLFPGRAGKVHADSLKAGATACCRRTT